MIELITLHRDGRLTVRIKDPDGAVDEYEFTRKGLVRVNAIFADGRILRADAAVLDAAFGSDRAELDDRVRQLFLDGSKFALN